MSESLPRGITYGVFVRFRRSRLALRRGIARIEEAVAIAEALRAERLHGRDEVFVARESDGVAVSDGSERSEPAGDGAPLRETARRARRAAARAIAASKQLETVAGAIGAAVERGDAPPSLVRIHAQAGAARPALTEALASFARARSLVESWLEPPPPNTPSEPPPREDGTGTGARARV